MASQPDRALLEFLYHRKPESHKGDHGRVLVVGGSSRYAGAPALAGLAALRTGADIAAILAPSAVANAIRSFSPDLIVYEYKGKHLNANGLVEFRRIHRKFDSFVLGSGLGLEKESGTALRAMAGLLKKGKKKFVLDADGLKLLKPADVAGCRCVVTPHRKEYLAFFGKEKPRDVCVILKGHEDRITFGKKIALNATGNPGMTVGGTGDVLAGALGALLANTDDLFSAACTAACLNGLAGDIAYKKFGNCLLATDVINSLPQAIMKARTA